MRLREGEIEKLIIALGGEPGRNGRTWCFLHQGKNPTTFSYTPEGLWYCFAEGRGGDAVDLVMQARGCSFKEALEFMADLGIVEAELALKTPQEAQKIKKELQERQRKVKRILRHAYFLWKAVERAAMKYDSFDMDLYIEVSRHFETLKKKLWFLGPETAISLERMRGAARAFFNKLPLTPTEKVAVKGLLNQPKIYELIYKLHHKETLEEETV